MQGLLLATQTIAVLSVTASLIRAISALLAATGSLIQKIRGGNAK